MPGLCEHGLQNTLIEDLLQIRQTWNHKRTIILLRGTKTIWWFKLDNDSSLDLIHIYMLLVLLKIV